MEDVGLNLDELNKTLDMEPDVAAVTHDFTERDFPPPFPELVHLDLSYNKVTVILHLAVNL